jgi:hypothetical protein
MGTKQRLRAERREAEQATDRGNLSVKFNVNDVVDEGVALVADGVEVDIEGQSDATAPQTVEVVTEEHEDEGESPIEALKKQFDEVKSAREASDRRALELERANRESQAALAQRAATEIGNQKALLEQAYNVEELKLADTKRKYAAALENRDFEAAADAQIEITKTTQLMGRYADAYQGLDAQEKAPRQAPAPQQVADPFEAALRKMDPRVAAWAREHKDDVIIPERQRLAVAADAMATARGMKPGTDAYLDFLDEQMGYLEPDDEPEQVRQPVKAQPRTKRMAAAPASRSSSSSGATNKVFLTEFDRDQARQLKMTEKEYAAFKVKSGHGQLSSAQAGGRLHARYTA